MFIYCDACRKYDTGDFNTMDELKEKIIKDGGQVEPERICPICGAVDTLRVD